MKVACQGSGLNLPEISFDPQMVQTPKLHPTLEFGTITALSLFICNREIVQVMGGPKFCLAANYTHLVDGDVSSIAAVETCASVPMLRILQQTVPLASQNCRCKK